MSEKKRLVVGISGASGAPIAVALLRAMRELESVETHLVITHGGELTLGQEAGMSTGEAAALADFSYDNNDIGAAIASGSFKTAGMIVVPCSMNSLASIATGCCYDLLRRAADVTLKERRRLLLVARECPLSTIHLRNMYELSQLGATILPPVAAYYNHPQTIDDVTNHIVGKILDCFDLDYPAYRRWDGSL